MVRIHLSNQDYLPGIDIFLISWRKHKLWVLIKSASVTPQENMLWVIIEVPRWGASNEYTQHVFFEEKEKFIIHNLDILSYSYEVLVLGQLNWIRKWEKLDKSSMVFPQPSYGLTPLSSGSM